MGIQVCEGRFETRGGKGGGKSVYIHMLETGGHVLVHQTTVKVSSMQAFGQGEGLRSRAGLTGVRPGWQGLAASDADAGREGGVVTCFLPPLPPSFLSLRACLLLGTSYLVPESPGSPWPDVVLAGTEKRRDSKTHKHEAAASAMVEAAAGDVRGTWKMGQSVQGWRKTSSGCR